jgi:hypothetical protein
MQRKKNEIEEAEQAPPAVIQPLPENRDKAMKVIFFLYMPDEFVYLSRLSYTAQQLLVPKPWKYPYGGSDGVTSTDVYNLIKVSSAIYSWKSHYNGNRACQYHHPSGIIPGKNLDVSLSMHMSTPERRTIGPKNVDQFYKCTDGVWYPDECSVRMVWKGGKLSIDRHSSGGEFNPFQIPDDDAGEI